MISEPITRLHTWWDRQSRELNTERPKDAASLLRSLEAEGLLRLPDPGCGRTRERFACLAAIGEIDLTLGRLAEAHADAASILGELHAEPVRPGQLWGVWAAEPPNARVQATQHSGGWRLAGRKAWCSGAGIYSHALVTAHAPDGPRLFAVELSVPEVRPVDGTWQALALTGSDTRSVDLDDAPATAVGGSDDYVARPGFWHGAAGVAAVWYGGAVSVARALSAAASRRPDDDLLLAQLGAVDVALAGAHAALTAAADGFDADPSDRNHVAAVRARRTRGVVEAAVSEVLDLVGRALGAAPLAMDRRHARRVADLQLYVRQSHADRDLADLGRRLLDTEALW
jgi:alkylation response protein AidB-like acyl-CoA dehydrogenase